MNNPPPLASVPSLPPAPPADMPQFERTRHGYDPAQVHMWATGLIARIKELEHAAEHAIGRGAHALVHDAETPQGQALLADLMKIATDELTGQQVQAAAAAADVARRAGAEAETKLAEASRQAAEVLRRADEEAGKLVSGAQEQSETVLQTARAQAAETVGRASAHAAAVHEGADRRLQQLMGLHRETQDRLAQIHDVTGQALEADRQRGTLADEVARATAVADPGAPQLPAEPAGL
jgi:hypothetical protein